MDDETIIKAFLGLPAEALPCAAYIGEPGVLAPWSALRVAVGRDEELKDLLGGKVRLHADRPEWSEIVIDLDAHTKE